MAQTIKLKRSATAGNVPSTSDLELGEVALNTTDGKMYIKKSVGGTESIVELGTGGGSAAADAIFVEYQYTATNNQTSFNGNDDNSNSLSYALNSIQVFLNGVLLDNGIDYTASNTVAVVLAEAATTGDFLQVFTFKKKISNGDVTVDTLSGNGSSTAYTLSVDPGVENNTRVYIDGVYQSKSNYSVSGTTLTFSTAPPNGTAIEVEIGSRDISIDNTSAIALLDNVKLKAGTGNDLEIFHDASNSYVKDVGTGNLKISSNNQVDITKGTSETMASFVVDGAVTLYHDNAAKIATSATGVTITGAAAATTFSGDLSGTINTATTATTQSAGNNSTKVATTAYVDVAIAALGDSAPSTLNTLNELAAALGDDANFAATTATALGLRVSKTADTGAAVMPAGTTAQRPTAVAGQFRYNSTLGKFEGYTDAWGEIGGGGAASFAADNFTGNGSTTAYALTTPAASEDNLLVFIEGVFQQQNAFSIATSGGTTTLTFSAAPANGNSIIIYRLSPAVNGTNLTSNTMTGDGSDTTLTLSAAPVNENNTQVFVNGVYQNKSTYSISGTTLTFSEAPPTGALVECMTMNQLDINVPVDDSITSAKLSGNLTTPGALTVTGALAGTSATFTTADNTAQVALVSTDADASDGPILEMFRNSSSPADDDDLGIIKFFGENDASEKIEYGIIEVKAVDVSDGTEDGSINLTTILNGTARSRLFSNSTETVFNEGSQDLDFRVESDNITHALFVQGSDGKVGIGTSSPATLLDIKEGTGATDAIIGLTAGTGGRAQIRSEAQADNTSSELSFHTMSGSNTSETMRISGSNVGIGTTSPAASLHISKNGGNAEVEALRLSNGDSGFTNNEVNQAVALTFDLPSSESGTASNRLAAKIVARKGGAGTNDWFTTGSSTNFNGQLDFYTRQNDVLTNQMTLDEDGNVGIGTSSPSSYFANASNLVVGGATGANGMTIVGSTDTQIFFADGTSGADAYRGIIRYSHADNGLSFWTDATQRMQIDASGIIISSKSSGIFFKNTSGGTNSTQIQISNTGGNLRAGVESSSGGAIQVGTSAYAAVFGNQANYPTQFTTNGTVRATIDSSGNLLVGKTSNTFSTSGFVANANGMSATRSGGACVQINRTSSDGAIQEFYKDGSILGSIDAQSGHMAVNAATGTGKLEVGGVVRYNWDANQFYPHQDNARDLGYPSYRWDDVYSTGGINTSDRNEKQDIEELSDAEQRVAVACKGLMRKFRWKSAVIDKGDDARIHVGIMAQDLQAAFEAEGLDPARYGMWCSNTWTDEETGEEITRMSVRYNELLAFIISAI